MTYIYRQLTAHDAVEAFRAHDRLRTPTTSGNFDYEGVNALFAYLEDLADDMGEPIEFDVVALCCDYAQYDSVEEAASEYDNDDEVAEALRVIGRDDDDADEARLALLDWLRDRTTVLELDSGAIIIQSF